MDKGGREMTAEITYGNQKKGKRGLDVGTVLMTAIVAFAGGIGVVAVFAVLTGADVHAWSARGLVGAYLLICTLLWGFLLRREFRTQSCHHI